MERKGLTNYSGMKIQPTLVQGNENKTVGAERLRKRSVAKRLSAKCLSVCPSSPRLLLARDRRLFPSSVRRRGPSAPATCDSI